MIKPSAAQVAEMEATRQEYIDEFKTDGESGDVCVPGSYSCHELLDRTAMLMNTLDQYVLGHPACVNNKEWFALAYRAVDALNELYQKVGADHLESTAEQKQLATDQ
jgi:hypothetical protein